MTATPGPTTTEVLQGAIDALQTYGHDRGAMINATTGALCLTGALYIGAGAEHCKEDVNKHSLCYPLERAYAFTRAVELVSDAIPRDFMPVLAYHPIDRVIIWNDRHCDGGEEAILVLKHALERAREEASLP